MGKSGGVLNAAEIGHSGRNFKAAQVRAPETDSVIRGSRFQRKGDLPAGMESNPRAGDSPSKSALSVHLIVMTQAVRQSDRSRPLPKQFQGPGNPMLNENP